MLSSEKRRFLRREGEKPSLGIASAPGPGGAASTANNIVLNNAALGNGVFYDTHTRLFRQFGRAAAARLGLGRIVALYHCPSALYHIH